MEDTKDFVIELSSDMLKNDKALLALIEATVTHIAQLHKEIDELIDVMRTISRSVEIIQETVGIQQSTINLIKEHYIQKKVM